MGLERRKGQICEDVSHYPRRGYSVETPVCLCLLKKRTPAKVARQVGEVIGEESRISGEEFFIAGQGKLDVTFSATARNEDLPRLEFFLLQAESVQALSENQTRIRLSKVVPFEYELSFNSKDYCIGSTSLEYSVPWLFARS